MSGADVLTIRRVRARPVVAPLRRALRIEPTEALRAEG